MECDPPLGMSSSVIHLIEFYEQSSRIGEPACLLLSTHPPLLSAGGKEGEWGVHGLLHCAVECLVSDFLPGECRELDRCALQETHCLIVYCCSLLLWVVMPKFPCEYW